jgi:hypothetical protein
MRRAGAIRIRHLEEIRVHQSLLQFSERFLLQKLNNRHIETSRQEGGRTEAGGEKVDEYRAHA